MNNARRQSAGQSDAVRAFLAAGCALIQIPLGEKGPRSKGWQKRENALFGAEHAGELVGHNAGIVHEHSHTSAIDIDNFDAADAWLTSRGVSIEALFLAEAAVSVSSGTVNRGKLLYRLPDGAAPLPTTKVKDDAGRVVLEFRCVGAQDVIAGTHPSGSQYSVSGDPATMPDLPAALLTIWRELIGNGADHDHGPRLNEGAQEIIPEGARNDRLWDIARKSHRAGFNTAAILAALKVENAARCAPPLPDSELTGIAHSAATLPERESARSSVPAAPSDDSEARLSLRPLTISELLDRPYPKWIVRGVLIEKGLGVVFGAPGSGKTFLVFDLAASVARGNTWFGRRVRQGGVIYVSGEGHLKARVAAYLAQNEIGADALAHLRVVSTTVNLLRPDGDTSLLVAELEKATPEMGGIVLVVLDTLNSMMAGGNENASEDMGAMVAAARAIMNALGCTVIYVHHSGKDEQRGSRGHSSLKAAVDTEIQITSADSNRILETIKMRDGEDGQKFAFRLEQVDLGPDPDPEADPDDRINSCVVVPLNQVPEKQKGKARGPKDGALVLKALRAVIEDRGVLLPTTGTIPPGAKGVSLTDWRNRYYTLEPIVAEGDPAVEKRAQDARRRRFDRAKVALLDEGVVMACTQWVWLA